MNLLVDICLGRPYEDEGHLAVPEEGFEDSAISLRATRVHGCHMPI